MTLFVRTSSFGAVIAVALDVPVAEDELHPEERARIATLAPLRQITFAGGRVALRRALTAAGVDAAPPIRSDDRGAPCVPAGYSGSIAHKETIAVALAGAVAPRQFLGVDVEYDRPARVDIARKILTTEEMAALADRTGEDRGRAVRVAFAVKEAIYKAIDPVCRRYVGFHEVALDLGGRDLSRGEVTPAFMLDPDAPPRTVDCSWEIAEGPGGEPVIVAMARARFE